MLFLCIISYVALVTGDSPIHCTGACLNNGTCLLTSKSAAYQLCHGEELYFNGSCHQIVEERKTWHRANEICEADGGSLVVIENELQQLFTSDFLLSNLKVDTSVHNVAVWTAGHVKLNGTRQVYVWSRNSYVTKMNLQENEPIMTGCIEIDSQSMFRDWIVVNCSRENYFICSRPTEMGELENVQCMCHNGYRGNFCDQSFSEFGISFESQSVACIDNEFEFSCPNGRSIQVDFAAYGNIGVSRELCLSSTQVEVNATDWEVCVHPSSLQTMISMCQGLTYCRISDLQSLFPDSPCLPTTPIILQYRMRCLFEPLIRCPLSAVYLNGRCYVPHVTDEPLSLFNAQTKCRKEGGQLASSVDQSARNEIAATVQKKVRYDSGACYWISEPRGPLNGSLCECYYITNNNAFWSQRNCSSSQQWVCQFAPEIVTFRPTEIYDKLMEQRIVFSGISNVERFEWQVPRYHF